MSTEQTLQALPEQIRNEQIRLIYKQVPIILIGSFVAAAALVGFIWNLVSHQALLIWSVLFIILAIIRGLVAKSYWANSVSSFPKDLPWGTLFFVGAGFAGCLWGAAAVVFFLPDKPEYILLIVMLYSGLISASAASSGAYMPAFYFFAIPAVVPFAIRLLADGRGIFTLMGLLTIFYLGICFVFVRTYHKNTLLLIQSQFENQALLEQVREEKQLAETSQRVAEQAMVEKNRFLAAASHDLRQPLHALGLFIGALRRETPESRLHLVDSIQGSVSALNHLFNSLLDVSRLDAGVVQSTPKHTHLDGVLERLHAEYLSLALERQLSLEIESDNFVVYTDGVLLERVLRNLLVNAINYTDNGKISIKCEDAGDSVKIQVIDTGIGIPENETKAIFSEYYQLNNPERDRNKGLGLGLAIVRRLCALMGIEISVKSKLGEGTTFTLEVQNGERRLVDRESPFDLSISIADLSVLVIDDEKSVLEGMRSILTGWGCPFVMAESADEAVTMIAELDFVPSIIFSDYRLRENKTGIEAIEAVYEELNRNVPAVVITGDTSPKLLKEVASSGFHLLHKPVTPDEFNQALVAWAEKID